MVIEEANENSIVCRKCKWPEFALEYMEPSDLCVKHKEEQERVEKECDEASHFAGIVNRSRG